MRSWDPLVRTQGLPSGRWVVAVSGGMDSMALLWELRFRHQRHGPPGGAVELVVAHLDHRMRRGSGADSDWLSGICRAWGVVLVRDRVSWNPTSEDDARRARYDFLDEVRRSTGGVAILTAHHADDQAETVLFRILRGTGVAGLQGIPARRGVIHRPMLHRSRVDIQEHVVRHGIPFRTDPSNRSRRYARNRIRHDVIPRLEAHGLPQLRRSLVRLSENARRAEAEREALEHVAFREVLCAPRDGRLEWPASTVAGWPDALTRRLLRSAARSLGVTLTASSTNAAVETLPSLRPGQGLDLSGGLRLSRGRERWILQRSLDDVWEEVEVGRTEPRAGVLRLGRRRFFWEWSPATPRGASPDPTSLALRPDVSLRLRGWRPGDRIRLDYGSKPVAKLLAERGVAAVDRPSTPILADPDGSIVWVPGAAVAAVRPDPAGRDSFVLRCTPETHG